MMTCFLAALVAFGVQGVLLERATHEPSPVVLRVATFNIQDVRREAIESGQDERLQQIASIIQDLRPNIILLNEIAYDPASDPAMPGAGGGGGGGGENAQLFLDRYLHTRQGGAASTGLEPPTANDESRPLLRYRAFMAPVNTGMPSGFDLNNDGQTVTTPSADALTPSKPGEPGARPSEEALAYAEDCWGFGTFPGQYGMALLVDERLELLSNQVRTFRLLPWDYLPGAMLPGPQIAAPANAPATTPGVANASTASGKPWFDAEELKVARLSSKSHWDVPVKLPNGVTLHVLCAHPTPPAFDGPEERNRRRNHDEIRLLADYINAEHYLVDDRNVPGGLPDGAPFIILGDLNADPDATKGNAIDNPVEKFLFSTPRVNADVTPTADARVEGLDDDDTAMFKMRVDYVLPSRDLAVLAAGVRRNPAMPGALPALESPSAAGAPARFPSDHFPVWMDLRIDP